MEEYLEMVYQWHRGRSSRQIRGLVEAVAQDDLQVPGAFGRKGSEPR